MQQQAAHVDIEAGALGASLPAFWRGNARTPPFWLETNAAAPGSLQNTRFHALRKASGATLTRLHPFATPGTLILHPDGTPIVRWESIDAALKQASEAGEDVIFDVQCPSTLSPEGWRAVAEATLRHYHDNPPAPIVRWEAALTPTEAVARYEPFARLARSLYPDTPIGLNLIAGDASDSAKSGNVGNVTAGNVGVNKQSVANVADAVGRVAQICARNKVPLDSLAWRLADTPGEAAQQAERIRRALAAFPTLKNVFLLPTLPAATINTAPDAVTSSENLPFARPASWVAQILQAVVSAPPNAFVGALLEEPTPTLSDKPGTGGVAVTPTSMDAPPVNAPTSADAAQEVFALLNRMAGTRLRAQSDEGRINCVASRSQTRTFVLLWREPLGTRSPARLTPLPANSNTLAIVRLHHLSLANSNGLRVTQTDLAQANIAMSGSVSSTIPVSPATRNSSNATDPETTLPLPPSGVADAFWSDNGAPTDVEAPVLLEPGGVCLLEITPLKVKNPISVSLTTEAVNVSGGDPLKVVLTVRNLSPRPQMLDVSFASAFSGLPPQGMAHFKPGLLPASGGRAFQFTFPAPVLGASANVTLNARVGDNAAMLTVPAQVPLLAVLESPRADVESGTGRANVRVRLTNRSLAPLTAHLQAGEQTGTSIAVPAGGKPVVAVLAVPPASREAGLSAVSLRVEHAGQVLQTLRPLVGVPVLCPYAAVKPALDGDLREWASNVPLGMGRGEQARGKTWGGPGDVSAYAYAQWDEQFFYFACAVTDDIFTPPTSAAALGQGDCVLFALATPPRANSPATSHSYAKFGMAVMRNRVGASVPTLVRLVPDPKSRDRETAVAVKNARFAVRREDARTFYEVAIPWRELLPGAASPDSAVSLSILINDVDGTARGSMEWGSGLYGLVNPLLFPPLRLIKSTLHQ